MIEYPEYIKLDKPMIFDTHAHLDDSCFDGERHSLIDTMSKSGVKNIITCGCDVLSSRSALDIAGKYGFIYAAVGIHPENLPANTDINEIKSLAENKKCVAIGEIGLDYHYDNSEKTVALQKKVFEEQIILANEINKPIIVHDRDAHCDTLELLKKHKPQGVVHCFSGSAETAKEILKLGMYIGIGGVITFKNAKKLVEVAKILPPDKILLETDCPYLAPEPLRGKCCHSGMISLTAQALADIIGTSRDELLNITSKNAKRLFNIT